MRPEDKPRFMSILVALAEVKGYEFTKEALLMWWRVMQDWDIEDFDRASVHVARVVKYKIQPADYFDLLLESVPNAHDAWYQVIEFAEQNRWQGRLDDPIIDAVLQRMGGLRALGRCPEGTIDFKKNDFVKMYAAMVKQRVASGSVALRLPKDMRPAIEDKSKGAVQ